MTPTLEDQPWKINLGRHFRRFIGVSDLTSIFQSKNDPENDFIATNVEDKNGKPR